METNFDVTPWKDRTEFGETDDGFITFQVDIPISGQMELAAKYIEENFCPASVSLFRASMKTDDEAAFANAVWSAMINEHLTNRLVAEAERLVENKRSTEELLGRMEG